MKRRCDRFFSHKFYHNIEQVRVFFRDNLFLRRWRKNSSTSIRLPDACGWHQQFYPRCYVLCLLRHLVPAWIWPRCRSCDADRPLEQSAGGTRGLFRLDHLGYIVAIRNCGLCTGITRRRVGGARVNPLLR